MIPLLGTAVVVAVVGLAAVAAAAWAVTAVFSRCTPSDGVDRLKIARGVARSSTYGTWAAAGLAVGLMEWALLTPDFSVRYVAETGSRELPLYYTVTALWAGPAGSLLFWVFVLATVVALLTWRVPRRLGATHPAALAVLAGLLTAFAMLLLAGAAPFQPVDPVPPDGPGPNPLLRDHPAMGLHPPLLYAGFAALAVPFALATGALLAGSVDRHWARAVRGWTLAAWAFLTIGIALGAWWSYAVLGWGGYWAWDPVENVSLMPWLLATALLHVVGPARRTGNWAVAAVALAGAAFLLVLLGTLLTRSGAVLSVHAFADSPLGPPLLAMFGLLLVGWAVLVWWRRDRLGTDRPAGSGALLSRQSMFHAQTVLLVLITVTILLGTVLPVLAQLGGDRLSVGAPWFNRTTGPAAAAVLVLMAVGPLVAWDRDDPGGLLRRLRWPGVAGLLAVGAVGLLGPGGVLLPIATGLVAFTVATLAAEIARPGHRPDSIRPRPRRRRVGALVAHAGITLAALAVVGTSYGASAQHEVAVGEPVVVGSSSATLLGFHRYAEPGRTVAAAPVLLGSGDQPVGTATPQLHFYPGHNMVVASPAVRSGVGRDLQVALLDVDPDAGTATLRLTVTPLLSWLWVAAGIVVAGGLVAALPARSRAARPAPAAPVATRQPAEVP
jgi:cytochrome c-type biogenesis protein CcmF